MALTKQITTRDTVTHSSAYVMVEEVRISKWIDLATLTIRIWSSAAARNGSNPAKDSERFTTEVTGDDFATYFSEEALKQSGKSALVRAYDWLKTQDNLNGYNFTNSQDV